MSGGKKKENRKRGKAGSLDAGLDGDQLVLQFGDELGFLVLVAVLGADAVAEALEDDADVAAQRLERLERQHGLADVEFASAARVGHFIEYSETLPAESKANKKKLKKPRKPATTTKRRCQVCFFCSVSVASSTGMAFFGSFSKRSFFF